MTDFTLSPQLIAWGQAHGYPQSELEAHAEWFADYLPNRTKKYKDLNAAFRNCVRSDWGKIRLQRKFDQKRDDWQANDQTICAKAHELRIGTMGKTTPQLVAQIRAELERRGQ